LKSNGGKVSKPFTEKGKAAQERGDAPGKPPSKVNPLPSARPTTVKQGLKARRMLAVFGLDTAGALRAVAGQGKVVEVPKREEPPTVSEPAQVNPTAIKRRDATTTGGKQFHREAFQIWVTEKLSYAELAKRVGVHEDSIFKWVKKEGWEELLGKIDARNKAVAVRTISEQTQRIAARHQKVARLAIRRIFGELKRGTLMIDPMTGLFHAKDDSEGTAKLRPLLPGEINQLLQGFQKAADLEYGRAGGNVVPVGAVDVRFPDLIKLLEAVWSGKARPEAIDVTPRVLAVTGSTDPREADT